MGFYSKLTDCSSWILVLSDQAYFLIFVSVFYPNAKAFFSNDNNEQ